MMSAKMIESQFLCDSCGTKVSYKENRCPRCGKFFNAVRCPSCQFVGENSLFKYGCPACGYALEFIENKKKLEDNHKHLKKPKIKFPPWFYYTSLFFLIIIILIFSILLFQNI